MLLSAGAVWASACVLLGASVAYVACGVVVAAREMRRMQRVVGKARGPRPLPVIGNALQLAVPPSRFFATMAALMERYAPSFVLWIGPSCFVLTADPRDYDFVMNNPKFNSKSPWYSQMHTALGRGLVVLSGEQWRRHRKASASSFHQQALVQYVEVFHRKAKDVSALLLAPAAASGAELNIKHFCSLVSMDTVCETMLSADMSTQREALQRFVRATNNASAQVAYRYSRPWLLNDFLYGLTAAGRGAARVTEETDRFVDEMVRRKGAGLRHDDDDVVGGGQKRRYFLQHVLQDPTAASLLSGEALREEAKSMVIAGEGSVANTLSFTLLMLAMHQDVQDAVSQELLDVFGGDEERAVTHEELPHLQLLERVVLETLRLFPVVTTFGRHCPEDTRLPSGVTVPAGSNLAFWNYYMHRDPQLYPDPLRFDPDRFLAEQVRSRPPLSFAAFSGGARACIGQRYAMMYLKTVLATVLRRYRVLRAPGDSRTVAELPVKTGVILSLIGGFPVTVSFRGDGAC